MLRRWHVFVRTEPLTEFEPGVLTRQAPFARCWTERGARDIRQRLIEIRPELAGCITTGKGDWWVK